MRYILVVDKDQKPLMPCHPARARELLSRKKAAVFRFYPFTVILLERQGGDTQLVDLKYDPGSKITGVVLVITGKKTNKVVWAAELHHRGSAIVEALHSRAALRRGRRARKTRYRAPRFLNRRRASGRLAPSMQSRIDNLLSLSHKLKKYTPIAQLSVESVKFDMQKLNNPEIHGTEYQRGTLFGYELREYLLEKWQRTCAYCDAQHIPLEIEHIIPRAKGGSDRASNLTLACRPCNLKKGCQDIQLFLANNPKRLARIKTQARQPLKDAAAVNTTRKALLQHLAVFEIPILTGTGGQTKFNRCQQHYSKAHWIDAACVGEQGYSVSIPAGLRPLQIQAMGRGSRQMCRPNRFGFPRTSAKTVKRVQGFQTGDWVVAIVPIGKKSGSYSGRVAVRSTGNFNVKTTDGLIQGIPARHCQIRHRADGYYYQHSEIERRRASSPR
jgi:5-methylcytosine-specific restriction endonuclease McrA